VRLNQRKSQGELGPRAFSAGDVHAAPENSCGQGVGNIQTQAAAALSELGGNERIANKLDADFYFVHPYSSWERGANENMNGLIRQFFPKQMAFELITTNDVELAMHQLNH
jgi:hypothetical protein